MSPPLDCFTDIDVVLLIQVSVSSFELLDVVPPRTTLEEGLSFAVDSTDMHRKEEALSISGGRAKRYILDQIKRDVTDSEFKVANSVLVSKWPSLNPPINFPCCFLVTADHVSSFVRTTDISHFSQAPDAEPVRKCMPGV